MILWTIDWIGAKPKRMTLYCLVIMLLHLVTGPYL